MIQNIDRILYGKRPPENKSYGWIVNGTLYAFNGKEWIATGGTTPFGKIASLDKLDPKVNNAYFEVAANLKMTFGKPENGMNTTYILKNVGKGPETITFDNTDMNLVFLGTVKDALTIPVGKYAKVHAISNGEKIFIEAVGEVA